MTGIEHYLSIFTKAVFIENSHLLAPGLTSVVKSLPKVAESGVIH